MSQNKNFLNKMKTKKPKAPVDLEVERQLLPRLKFMGVLLLIFSVITFAYIIIQQEHHFVVENEPLTPAEREFTASLGFSDLAVFEESDPQKVNIHVVASSFVVVGIACLYCVWSRKKRFFPEGF